MKGEFLLEIGTEEVPASYIMPALDAMAALFIDAMKAALIVHGEVKTAATPRRLVLHAADVDVAQASREIEKTGPAKAQAFDADGKPTKAAIGFARGQGVDVADLIVIKTPKGEQVAVRKTEPGRPTVEVMAEILPGLIEKVPFPKSMRWMDLDVRFVRPVHWIVAVLNGQVVPFQFGSIASGDSSRGHRFTHPEPFPARSFEQLRNSLAHQGVLIDPAKRRKKIAAEIANVATAQGLEVFADEELLDEVTFLVESPYPVMGEFAAEFLELPESILRTCMKKHQRYFSVRDKSGSITNRFVAVNNTPVKDPSSSVRGHERVLKARLEDARFYFREDRETPLINRLEALKGVVFHSKLGTSYEKVQRFTSLATRLAERFAPDRVKEVERAALLAKCDLETGIVYEFPELQGIIGSYYARLDGEPADIADAVREHYLPAYAGDSLPSGILGAVVSLADRMDTIAGCFAVGLIPTGAADPYALRRHALAIIQILIHLDQALDLPAFLHEAFGLLDEKRTRDRTESEQEVLDFIRTRFVYFHTSRDFPLDAVEAVVRPRFDDVVDARRRVEALSEWKRRDDFDAIMVGFKRVVNILKNTSPGKLDPGLLVEPAEQNLFEVFKQVKDIVTPLIDRGEYAEALEAMVRLKAPIDKLFDDVMVMVEDEKVRNNRLGLLKMIADLFARMVDFSFVGSTAETK
jgi:glycyl-tRNA synthetase beta chain